MVVVIFELATTGTASQTLCAQNGVYMFDMNVEKLKEADGFSTTEQRHGLCHTARWRQWQHLFHEQRAGDNVDYKIKSRTFGFWAAHKKIQGEVPLILRIGWSKQRE
jgi:hypothetical protein